MFLSQKRLCAGVLVAPVDSSEPHTIYHQGFATNHLNPADKSNTNVLTPFFPKLPNIQRYKNEKHNFVHG